MVSARASRRAGRLGLLPAGCAAHSPHCGRCLAPGPGEGRAVVALVLGAQRRRATLQSHAPAAPRVGGRARGLRNALRRSPTAPLRGARSAACAVRGPGAVPVGRPANRPRNGCPRHFPPVPARLTALLFPLLGRRRIRPRAAPSGRAPRLRTRARPWTPLPGAACSTTGARAACPTRTARARTSWTTPRCRPTTAPSRSSTSTTPRCSRRTATQPWTTTPGGLPRSKWLAGTPRVACAPRDSTTTTTLTRTRTRRTRTASGA